jgi:hypothetical protein
VARLRLTFGQFRTAVANPDWRPSDPRPQWPTTTSTLNSAVRTYYSEGLDSAYRRLDRGLSGYFARPGRPAGMARRARALFDVYVNYAADDPGPAFAFGVSQDVPLIGADVQATADVVFYAEDGYVARVILWGTAPLTAPSARVLGALTFLGMDAQLGSGRTSSVDVWHIRSGTLVSLDRSVLPDGSTAAEAIVGRLA